MPESLTTDLEFLLSSPIQLTGEADKYLLGDTRYDRTTDILHGVLPPYLVPWAENVGYEAAYKVYKVMGDKLPDSWEEIRDTAREMQIDCESMKVKGQERGLESHLALETWIKQGIPPSLDDFSPEARPFGQSLCAWLVAYEPEFECSEITVWHPGLGYAGTIDAIGKVTKHPQGVRHPNIVGKRFAFDLKTNKEKRIYYQHYMQLAAYRCALDHHDIEIDGEAVVALGPSPWKNSGNPWTVGVNYIPAHLWEPIVAAYRAVEESKKLNPNARS